MARGWESKSVEEQINAIEDKKDAQAKQALSASERKRRVKREGLLRERARLVREIEAARNERYRTLLERALAHVEGELGRADE